MGGAGQAMGGAGQAMGGASQAAWPGRVRSAVENPILGKSSQTFQRRHAVFGWQVNSQLKPFPGAPSESPPTLWVDVLHGEGPFTCCKA